MDVENQVQESQHRPGLIQPCEVEGCDGNGVVVVREGPLQGKRLCVGHLDDHGEAAGWWGHSDK